MIVNFDLEKEAPKIAEWIFDDNVEKGIAKYTELTDDAQFIVYIKDTMENLFCDITLAVDDMYDMDIYVEPENLSEEFKKTFLVTYLTLAKAYAREFGYAFRIDHKKDAITLDEVINSYSKEKTTW